MLEDHRAPVVTLQVWYKVGSRNERTGITGISHLLEHLMFRGTPKYGQGEFSRLVQDKGGSRNAFTSDDQTVYFENIASSHLDLLLELEADRMANLTLDEASFSAERKIVMEERRLRTADEPAADLYEQVSAAAYTAHPYGWPVVGWMSDLENMTLVDVKAYRQLFYAPSNAILVVAGDISPEALLPKIKATFGAIRCREADTKSDIRRTSTARRASRNAQATRFIAALCCCLSCTQPQKRRQFPLSTAICSACWGSELTPPILTCRTESARPWGRC